MTLWHGRHRRQVSLLAAGALREGPEREAARAHLDVCTRCREDHRAIRAVLELTARDPVRDAEPPLSAGALTTRVLARLDVPAAPVRRPAFWLVPGAAAAAAVLALIIFRPNSPDRGRIADRQIVVSDATLARLERNVARGQAARYLNAAQDVLVTVGSRPPRCHRERGRVDVADETRRSRELLARRAMLVEMDRDDVAMARPIVEDVDRVLREVAALDPCVRPEDVETIRREIERRQLLLKIRLTTRELEG